MSKLAKRLFDIESILLREVGYEIVITDDDKIIKERRETKSQKKVVRIALRLNSNT